MTLGRLHPSDEYDIRIAVEEGEGGSLDGKWIAMLVDEIEHYSGENERLAGLLLTSRQDRDYAEMKQRAEEAERQMAVLREAARTVLDHIDDVEWAQDPLRHDEDTERLRVALGLPADWVSAMRARGALAAAGGDQPT